MLRRIHFLTISLFVFGTANAAVVQGDYLGTFAGNDSDSAMMTAIGVNVSQLIKINSPATSNGAFLISGLGFNGDGEAISGEWSYSGAAVVDYIVIKAGPQFAVYQYSDFNTGGMRNTGLWDTSAVDFKGLSHISTYSANAVPVPAAAWLLGSALMGLAAVRRRR